MVVQGSCLCGAVAYEARLPLAKFVNCHCSRCRKATGSAHSANAYVLPDAFARSFATAFCSRCGAPVPHATRSGREIIIPAGTLDDDPGVKPSINLHCGS